MRIRLSGLASPLDRKLLRELFAMRGQALAIALVIGAGVASAVAMYGMLDSLTVTRDAYYERYRFADVWAPVTRAPARLADHLAAIPGVRQVGARIAGAALLDVPGMMEPAHGTLVSIPPRGRPPVNDFVLRSGRLPDPERPGEVLLSEAFAEAHGLGPGTAIAAVVHGRRQVLEVVGIALSPEFVAVVAPGEVTPDDRRAAVLWMSRAALEAAYDLEGAFNEAALSLMPGASVADVIARADRLLARYGATGAYGRKDQLADSFLRSDMEQLAAFAAIVVPVFLVVAAFLLGTVVGRLVDTQRQQIGLLKAFGYSDHAVAWHFLKLTLAIIALGVLLGFAAGAWLGRTLAELYAAIYDFPFLFYRPDPAIYVVSALLSVLAGLAGTVGAARRAARLAPAAAMAPPAPARFGRTLSERLLPRALIGPPGRMVVRQIVRRPVRALLTMAGIAASLGLLVATTFSLDAIDHMLDVTFFKAERQDMTLTFAEARGRAAEDAVMALPGVLAAEPFRTVPAKLSAGQRTERVAIMGLVEAPRLVRVLDRRERALSLPPEGIVLSAYLAGTLGVVPGERITVAAMEDRRPVADLVVANVVEQYVGSGAYMDLAALNRLMGEGRVVSGAYVEVDAARLPALFGAVKETPMLAGASLRGSALTNVRTVVEENLLVTIFVNSVFAGLIAFGVVYNTARLTLAERERELASLRVLGFTGGEVAGILVGELMILTVLALPVGWLLGAGLALLITTTMSGELFTIPYVIERTTYATATLVVLGAAAASAALVARRVGALDLVGVLKTRG